MRNKVDFSLPPEVLFLNPWQDPGFRLLLEPEFVWRPVEPASINGFSVSAHVPINKKINRALRLVKRTKTFSKAIEYNAVPVVLERASFRKSFVMARDRMLLSGPSAGRLLHQYHDENRDKEVDSHARIKAFFSACRERNAGKEIPVYARRLDADTHFAVECRNTFNYYHFITESLAQLTVLDGLDFRGNIYFHFPNLEEKQRPFARDFVDALFPEYQGRMFFERAPKDYDKVLTCYDMIGGHFQSPVGTLRGMIDHAPEALFEKGGVTSDFARQILPMNSASSTLFALRERAMKAIEGKNFDHLPKRFFVGRDTRFSRERHMDGEDVLFDHLKLFGFEYVVFEALSPLEQIALMARAEMMVSYHGAGFTNMLFAGPQTYVVELGTLQSMQLRWRDFWPLAHVAGCKYVSFFGDFRSDTPEIEPDFDKDGLLPVSLSKMAIGQIMAFVVTAFGQYPELKSKDLVSSLARQMLQIGDADKAVGLLEAHADMVAADSFLCLIKADCHKALDEPKSELVALDQAYKADNTRWQTLIRMIWCANRCERPQVIRWALIRLQIDFPARHDKFVGNHKWLRYVA